MTNHPLYPVWARISARTLCPRWQSFRDFIADLVTAPAGQMLERIDGKRPFEPGNVRWIDAPEGALKPVVMREPKAEPKPSKPTVAKKSVFVTYGKASLTLPEWLRKAGIDRETYEARIAEGMTFGEAMGFERENAPVRNGAGRPARMIEGKTIPQWAAELGLARSTIDMHLKAGKSIREIAEVPSRPAAREITYEGRTMSLAEWGRERAVRPPVLWQRLDKGWSVGEALGFEKRVRPYKKKDDV